MEHHRLIAGVLFAIACSLTVVLFLIPNSSSGKEPQPKATPTPDKASFKPLPPPVQPQNVVKLSPAEQLGKDIFFDHTLSNPTGYACATCHVPAAGFTGPSSEANEYSGPVPGVIPGRFGRRKPQSVT